MKVVWETPSPEPVALPGQLNGEHDAQGMATGNVIRVGDRYLMWFSGNGDGATGMGFAVGHER